MRGTILLRVVSNGRGIFLAAGGILGVGLYGFVATFEPYNSGRVMQPLRVVEAPLMAASFAPLEIFPASAPWEAVAELAPELDAGVALPITVRALPQPPAPAPAASVPVTTAPPVEAAGTGGIEPLSPMPGPQPPGDGPVVGDSTPVPFDASNPSRHSPPASPGALPKPSAIDEPKDDDEGDATIAAGSSAAPSDGRGNGKGNAEGRGNGNAANQGNGDADNEGKARDRAK